VQTVGRIVHERGLNQVEEEGHEGEKIAVINAKGGDVISIFPKTCRKSLEGSFSVGRVIVRV
jgi:hypothetical protein